MIKIEHIHALCLFCSVFLTYKKAKKVTKNILTVDTRVQVTLYLLACTACHTSYLLVNFNHI